MPGVTAREGATVRRYLETLSTTPDTAKRKVSREVIESRLANIDRRLIDPATDVLERLALIQQRIDLLTEREKQPDPAAEERFVKVAAAYSERKRITYAAWREVGVPAAVLRRAGIFPNGKVPEAPAEGV